MGIMSRMIRPQAINTEMERVIREVMGGGSTTSGVAVSNEKAMQHATVYSCVNILSRVIGMLPCHMMIKEGNNREIASDFSLYSILHDLPNEWMTSMEFWGMAMNHLALRGNFVAIKNKDARGNIRELIPVAPGMLQDVTQNKDYSLTYKLRMPDGSNLNISNSEIFHLRGMVMNGYMGVNPIQYIRESIGLGLATEEFGARYFGSGTHPGMILEHPGKLSPQAHSNLKQSMGETYSGLGKAHKLMLLEEGMKAHAVTINPEDSQFLETRKYQKSEIVDIFMGNPLTLMGSGDSTPTFASAEQFSISFVTYALMPWLVTIEKAIYRDLLTPSERNKYYAKFKAEGLQRGSFADQTAGFATLIDKEVLSPNDVRSILDMNPYPGGEEYRTRTSTTKEPVKTNQDGDK